MSEHDDNIQQMIFGALAKSNERGKGATVPLLTAQADDLRARWESAQQPTDLKEGDLVMEKRGLGCQIGETRKNVLLIVWRMLDFKDFRDVALVHSWTKRGLTNTDRLDCMVGEISYGSGNPDLTGISPHQLSQLERWDGRDVGDPPATPS